ncbi:MAG TPA: DUF4145 domain-containing protein [Methylophilaceae bacterium]|jgi:hypothetical protein
MYSWEAIQTINSRSYTCGYCGSPLSSERGWRARNGPSGVYIATIYICHKCASPTFFDIADNQTPGIVFGNVVSDIPEENVSQLYEEARRTTGAGAYTAAVLCCRKLLMHIAVSKGANAGDTFINYVQFLADKNFIPPDAKEWVDHIRKKGNEANHEISIMSKDDAEELLSFCEMLLKVIFEFPAIVKRRIANP